RRKIHREETVFIIGDYRLDMSNQTLTYLDREPITLSMIEAKLLEKLAMNLGLTVDAGSLMQLIWQRDDPFSRNSLHGFIHKLRNYLRHDNSISLINQRGIGYMLAICNR
ncbi:MAG: winged helix-turn-helix domain-containing protein, partial [Duncaniella sp.]|nr:winged helix-turn-helix domain-containing protein [Duncaniella sp.]